MEKHREIHRHPGKGNKWNPEIMAGAIFALKEAKYPVNPNFLLHNHSALFQAMTGFPGGWGRIVSEAGLDPSEEKRNHGAGFRKKPYEI